MITLSSLTSYANKLLDPSIAGEVQNLISVTIELSELSAPPLYGWLLRWGIANIGISPWLPNLPFGIGAVSILISMGVLLTLPSVQAAKSWMNEEKQSIDASIWPG